MAAWDGCDGRRWWCLGWVVVVGADASAERRVTATRTASPAARGLPPARQTRLTVVAEPAAWRRCWRRWRRAKPRAARAAVGGGKGDRRQLGGCSGRRPPPLAPGASWVGLFPDTSTTRDRRYLPPGTPAREVLAAGETGSSGCGQRSGERSIDPARSGHGRWRVQVDQTQMTSGIDRGIGLQEDQRSRQQVISRCRGRIGPGAAVSSMPSSCSGAL